MRGLAFEVPDRHQLPPRLDAVLDAIYAAYGSGWDDIAGSDPRRRGLAHEAVWLARTVLQLMPDEPEARGLLALMLLLRSTPAGAAAPPHGDYVPMSEQNAGSGRAAHRRSRARAVGGGGAAPRAGRFQLEAALQSAHVDGARRGEIDWRGIALLYEGPGGDLADSRGVRRPRRGARRSGRCRARPRGARRDRSARSPGPISPTGPCARTCSAAPDTGQALGAYDRAIGFTEDASTRQFLLCRRAELPLSGI